MNIRFTARNIDKVKKKIASIPRPFKIAFMRAFTEYIIGDESRGLKHEPPEKFVKRRTAYPEAPTQPSKFSKNSDVVSMSPKGYFSWAQFHKVGMLTNWFTKKYERTHELASGWTMNQADSNWTRVNVENKADGVGWVMGDNQARQPAKVGWRWYWDVVSSNLKGGISRGMSAVNAMMKQKGK